MQQFSIALGATKESFKLGQGLVSIFSLTKSLNNAISINKQDMIDYLKDLSNLQYGNFKDYANNFIMQKLNSLIYVTRSEFVNIGIEPKILTEKWSNYQLESNVYKYLYTRFWEVIVESVINNTQTDQRFIQTRLKISPKTYTQFYHDLELQEDKAKKLMDDIFAFREYNLLTYYIDKKDIFLNEDNVIVPIMIRV